MQSKPAKHLAPLSVVSGRRVRHLRGRSYVKSIHKFLKSIRESENANKRSQFAISAPLRQTRTWQGNECMGGNRSQRRSVERMSTSMALDLIISATPVANVFVGNRSEWESVGFPFRSQEPGTLRPFMVGFPGGDSARRNVRRQLRHERKEFSDSSQSAIHSFIHLSFVICHLCGMDVLSLHHESLKWSRHEHDGDKGGGGRAAGALAAVEGAKH